MDEILCKMYEILDRWQEPCRETAVGLRKNKEKENKNSRRDEDKLCCLSAQATSFLKICPLL